MAANGSENIAPTLEPQSKIPSRAVLARRWPRLRLNRYSGHWLDEASGRRGDDLASLARYLEGAPR
ncbi:hypothetical protein A1351_06730 [Methylosinus sp. R-45379]|nr:hypothetical protein A1351_06730 [Methylosinus sp. R-45379]